MDETWAYQLKMTARFNRLYALFGISPILYRLFTHFPATSISFSGSMGLGRWT